MKYTPMLLFLMAGIATMAFCFGFTCAIFFVNYLDKLQ
jgi:hypothetical protein